MKIQITLTFSLFFIVASFSQSLSAQPQCKGLFSSGIRFSDSDRNFISLVEKEAGRPLSEKEAILIALKEKGAPVLFYDKSNKLRVLQKLKNPAVLSAQPKEFLFYGTALFTFTRLRDFLGREPTEFESVTLLLAHYTGKANDAGDYDLDTHTWSQRVSHAKDHYLLQAFDAKTSKDLMDKLLGFPW